MRDFFHDFNRARAAPHGMVQPATVLTQHGYHLDFDSKDLWSFNNASNS
jgi:hypothetical protein